MPGSIPYEIVGWNSREGELVFFNEVKLVAVAL